MVLIGLVFVLLIMAAATWYVRYVHVRDEVDTPASELLNESETTSYTTLTGEPFSFETYRGRIRVVTVWASWSPYTARELSVLEAIASVYPSEQVATFAVNRKEPKERAAAYLATVEPVSNVVMVIDETDAFYTSVGGYAMPETILFDAAGNIAWHHRGEVSVELLRTEIDKLVRQ